jgi:uncharacterized protein YabE (DUF348 family)/3D (Asp-Asp-Asp) domain-containing protein
MQERKHNVVKRKKSIIRMAVLAIPLALLLLLSQTAFAQNTYVITDGDRVVVYTSSATDPAAVLDEAGLALGADDTYTTQTGIGISEIKVQRSVMVTVDNCGEILSVNAKDETVASLLKRLGIQVDGGTTVSVPLELTVSEGMKIMVTRSVQNTETYTTAIPYETVYCYDTALPAGQESVVTEGAEGLLLCTATVVYVDGQESSRTVLKQNVIRQPVNKVVAVGTGTDIPVSKFSDRGLVITEDQIILPTGEVLTYKGTMQAKGTAYTHTDAGCDFYTATQTYVHIGTVAVDPRVIPWGTRMFIVTNDGEYIYGVSTAEDSGSSIKNDRIDLYFPTTYECIQFGVRDCTVYFLG